MKPGVPRHGTQTSTRRYPVLIKLKLKIDSDANFWLPSGMAAMANERCTMVGATTTLCSSVRGGTSLCTWGSLDIVHTAPTYAVEQAVIMVQGVWRKRQGWKMLMAAMASVWSKTVDPSTGAVYYYNYRTGEAKWEKPLLFGGKDVEDFAGQLEEMQTKQREKVKRGKGASKPSFSRHSSLFLSFSCAVPVVAGFQPPRSVGCFYEHT